MKATILIIPTLVLGWAGAQLMVQEPRGAVNNHPISRTAPRLLVTGSTALVQPTSATHLRPLATPAAPALPTRAEPTPARVAQPRPGTPLLHANEATRHVADIQAVVERRLASTEVLEGHCPTNLALSLHRVGLDPEHLSDADLRELARKYRALADELQQDLRKLRWNDDRNRLVGFDPDLTSALRTQWEQFSERTDSLSISYL